MSIMTPKDNVEEPQLPIISKFLIGLISLLVVIPILVNIVKIQNFCLNGYDIGIYFQAMLEVDPPQVWNPHLSIRGIKAFNDHFNPALIPVAEFLKLFVSFTPIHVIVFEWSIWVFSLFLFWKLMSDWSLKLRILALFLVLTAKGALTPLYFPAHVDYWAMPLWIGLTWAAYQARWRLFLACLFAICFFKESYPIAFLFTGLTLLYLRQRALSVTTLSFCGVFTY